MSLVHKLECQGLEVELDPNGIALSPVELITDEIRQWVRQHRSKILDELRHQERLRASLFHKGLTKEQSSHLMDLIMTRDVQLDDRRTCAECQHSYFIKGKPRCQRGLYPIGHNTPYTVHRCRGFTEAVPMQEPLHKDKEQT